MPTNSWLALLLACLVSGCAGMPNLLQGPKTCAKVCPDGRTASYIAPSCKSDPCSGHADAAAPPRRDPPAWPSS
jgi:hypothetical protein